MRVASPSPSADGWELGWTGMDVLEGHGLACEDLDCLRNALKSTVMVMEAPVCSLWNQTALI